MSILWNTIGRFLFAFASILSAIPVLEKRYCIKQRLRGPWPQGPYLWLHGASMGECKMLLELVRLMQNDLPHCPPILITTQKTEVIPVIRKMIADASLIHVKIELAPADTPASMRTFISQVKPTKLILAENELWPGYLSAMKNFKGTGSAAIVSGRYYGSIPGVDFSVIKTAFMQSDGDLERIQHSAKNTIREIHIGGNWKMLPWAMSGSMPAPRESQDIDKSFISIHFPEWKQIQPLIIDSCQKNETVVLFPRRLEETEAFRTAITSLKIPAVEWPHVQAGAVTLVKQFGQTRAALQRTRHAIIGGSFCKKPGVHDFWESLLMGVPTSIGPFACGQQDTARRLVQQGILRQIRIPSDDPSSNLSEIPHMLEFLIQERKTLLDSYQQFLNFIKDTNHLT